MQHATNMQQIKKIGAPATKNGHPENVSNVHEFWTYKKAVEEIWTPDLFITNEVLYPWATTAYKSNNAILRDTAAFVNNNLLTGITVIIGISHTSSYHHKDPYKNRQDDVCSDQPLKSDIGGRSIYKRKNNGQGDKYAPATKSQYCKHSFYSHLLCLR